MYPKLDNRPWRVVTSENILHLGPWLSVRQETVELPSGAQVPTWFILEFPNWVNVIALTKDGKHLVFCAEANPKNNGRPILDEAQSHKLLWPIDKNVMNSDKELKQTPGY